MWDKTTKEKALKSDVKGDIDQANDTDSTRISLSYEDNKVALDTLASLPPEVDFTEPQEFNRLLRYSDQSSENRLVSRFNNWEMYRRYKPSLVTTYQHTDPSAKVTQIMIKRSEWVPAFNITVNQRTPELYTEFTNTLRLNKVIQYDPHTLWNAGFSYYANNHFKNTIDNLCQFICILTSFDSSIDAQILRSMVGQINGLLTPGSALLKVDPSDSKQVIFDDAYISPNSTLSSNKVKYDN